MAMGACALLEVAGLIEACGAEDALHRHVLLSVVRGVSGLGFVHSVERGRDAGLHRVDGELVDGEVVLHFGGGGHPEVRVADEEHIYERSLFGNKGREM